MYWPTTYNAGVLLTLYARCQKLVQQLQPPGVAQSLLEALLVQQGNSKLAAVQEAVSHLEAALKNHTLRLPLALHREVLAIAVQLRQLNLQEPWWVSELLRSLQQAKHEHHFIAPGGQEPMYELFKQRFPTAGWRFVDWEKHPWSWQWPHPPKHSLVEWFGQLSQQHSLEGKVLLTWSDDVGWLELDWPAVVQLAEVVFVAPGDVLIVGPQARWALEWFHEGQVGFGLAP